MKDILKQICKNEPDSIQAAVAQEVLDYDDPQAFFNDLQQNGCVSGMVSKLIYYTDTHAFYDKHYEEIEELRTEYEESTGEPLQIGSDLKNYLAWFAFEQVAYELVNEYLQYPHNAIQAPASSFSNAATCYEIDLRMNYIF